MPHSLSARLRHVDFSEYPSAVRIVVSTVDSFSAPLCGCTMGFQCGISFREVWGPSACALEELWGAARGYTLCQSQAHSTVYSAVDSIEYHWDPVQTLASLKGSSVVLQCGAPVLAWGSNAELHPAGIHCGAPHWRAILWGSNVHLSVALNRGLRKIQGVAGQKIGSPC